MRFWDASAILPLCIRQPASGLLDRERERDPGMIVWWATPVECWSAVARLARDGFLEPPGLRRAGRLLDRLSESWFEVLPSDGLRESGRRLLRRHELRAPGALQLAAALEWSDPPSGEILTLDTRLAAAARIEGLRVPLLEPF